MHEVVETSKEILWAGAADFPRTIPRSDATKLSLNHPFMGEAFSYYKDFGEGCFCDEGKEPVETSFKAPRFSHLLRY
uniref:Uncharacterized protein n=1 Tax=Bracon brevicornis TaxID=1563983 RepID=A0A6V7LDT8_9HYME